MKPTHVTKLSIRQLPLSSCDFPIIAKGILAVASLKKRQTAFYTCLLPPAELAIIAREKRRESRRNP